MPVMCIRFTDRLVRLDQRHCAAAVPPVSGFRYTVLNLFGCLTNTSQFGFKQFNVTEYHMWRTLYSCGGNSAMCFIALIRKMALFFHRNKDEREKG